MAGLYTERVECRFPPRLTEKLELAAKADEISVSQFVRDTIKRRLDDIEPRAAAG